MTLARCTTASAVPRHEGLTRSQYLALDRLRAFTKPVLFVLGGRSNPDYYRREVDREMFPDFTLEVFEERHPFDPPHRDRT